MVFQRMHYPRFSNRSIPPRPTAWVWAFPWRAPSSKTIMAGFGPRAIQMAEPRFVLHCHLATGVPAPGDLEGHPSQKGGCVSFVFQLPTSLVDQLSKTILAKGRLERAFQFGA